MWRAASEAWHGERRRNWCGEGSEEGKGKGRAGEAKLPAQLRRGRTFLASSNLHRPAAPWAKQRHPPTICSSPGWLLDQLKGLLNSLTLNLGRLFQSAWESSPPLCFSLPRWRSGCSYLLLLALSTGCKSTFTSTKLESFSPAAATSGAGSGTTSPATLRSSSRLAKEARPRSASVIRSEPSGFGLSPISSVG